MDLHERQQFDFLLQTAVDRFVERIEQRNEGASKALNLLRTEPNGKGIWLDGYVDAIFADFLLDNVEGACFVLKALARRAMRAHCDGPVESVLIDLAKSAFKDLLRVKAEEALEQHSGYEAVNVKGNA